MSGVSLDPQPSAPEGLTFFFFFFLFCLWEVVDFLTAESSNWNCFPSRKRKIPSLFGFCLGADRTLGTCMTSHCFQFLHYISVTPDVEFDVACSRGRASWVTQDFLLSRLFFSRKNAKCVQCNVLLCCELIIFAFPTNGTTAQHPKGSWHLADAFWAQAEWICNNESGAQLFGIKKSADSFSSVNRSSSCASWNPFQQETVLCEREQRA